ncbi:hypothetical protein TNCT_705651, partial [Trichonephila clavata]
KLLVRLKLKESSHHTHTINIQSMNNYKNIPNAAPTRDRFPKSKPQPPQNPKPPSNPPQKPTTTKTTQSKA